MAVTKAQKDEILVGLKAQFARAQGVVFAEFRGLSVNDAQTLRRGLRDAGLEYKVAKKTLVKLAAKEQGYDLTNDVMEGPIGVTFGFDDEIVAAQKMAEFAKKFPAISLKGGIIEGKVVNEAMVKMMASIPSRDVLLAKFMGSAMAPLTGFVGIGNSLLSGFVRVVNAYQEQRVAGGEAAPVAETPVAVAEAVTPAEVEVPEVAEEVAASEEVEAPAEEVAEEVAPVEGDEPKEA